MRPLPTATEPTPLTTTPPARRQQAFEFAQSGLWQRLSEDIRRDCQQQLTGLLMQIHEHERNHDHERHV
jgi:hypothetical protein